MDRETPEDGQLQQAVNQTQVRDWQYLAEGAANIVLRYVGRDSRLQSYAMRVGKCKLGEDAAELENRNVEYTNNVIAPMFDAGVVCELIKVTVEKVFLEEIANKIELERPAIRRNTDKIAISAKTAVLVQNMTRHTDGQSTLSIEIKPKHGFMPSQQHLSPETRQLKAKYCRYCMHTTLKSAEKGQEIERAIYCPLQLYSDELSEREAGLRKLWSLWQTKQKKQNNLRLFVNGQPVCTESDPVWTSILDRSSRTPQDLFLQAATDALEHTQVLRRLKELQSQFDPIDIEGVANLVQQMFGISLYDSARYGNSQERTLTQTPTIQEFLQVTDESHNPTIRNTIVSYLLSATVKDCSIFIRATIDNIDCHETTLKTELKLVDLDEKPVTRLGHYAQLDRRIVQTFGAFLESHVSFPTCTKSGPS